MPRSSRKQTDETPSFLGTPQTFKDEVRDELDQAVGRYESAKLALENFRQKHPHIMAQLDALRAELDESYNDAKTLYGDHYEAIGTSYAGFSVVQKRSVDVEKLIKVMPDLIAVLKYTMPMPTFDQLCAEGAIPADLAEQVVLVTHSVSGPKK
jgi:DNA repair exonuclease SbcCD ATPase subunit